MPCGNVRPSRRSHDQEDPGRSLGVRRRHGGEDCRRHRSARAPRPWMNSRLSARQNASNTRVTVPLNRPDRKERVGLHHVERRDGVDLDQRVLVRESLDLHHRGGGRLDRKEFAPDSVDVVEHRHVGDVDVDANQVREGATRRLDATLQVLADLARLRTDVADANQLTVGIARQQSGNVQEVAWPRPATAVDQTPRAWKPGT